MRTLLVAVGGLIGGLVLAILVMEALARPMLTEGTSGISTGEAILLGLVWPVCAIAGVVTALLVDRRARR